MWSQIPLNLTATSRQFLQLPFKRLGSRLTVLSPSWLDPNLKTWITLNWEKRLFTKQKCFQRGQKSEGSVQWEPWKFSLKSNETMVVRKEELMYTAGFSTPVVLVSFCPWKALKDYLTFMLKVYVPEPKGKRHFRWTHKLPSPTVLCNNIQSRYKLLLPKNCSIGLSFNLNANSDGNPQRRTGT